MKPDLKQITLDLLKAPTRRDQQVKVGASNFSQPCPRCLADDLLGIPKAQGPYWAGAVIGTAIHAYLEQRATELQPTFVTEQRLVLGDLPGYGTIKSTTDLYLPEQKTATDYKTTTKAKLKFIKGALNTEYDAYEVSKITEARYKVAGYLNQVMTYAKGLTDAGFEVEWVSLVFICRDASTDDDVWAFTTEYDPDKAAAVWNRLERLWTWLQAGNDPEGLTSSPECYYCRTSRS